MPWLRGLALVSKPNRCGETKQLEQLNETCTASQKLAHSLFLRLY